MFNVYWGTEYINDILKVLDKFNVKTTFFVGGTWAEKEQDVLENIYKSGHEIANHGYFHKNQDKLNYEQNYDEIYATHTLVKTLINVEMNLFAPPSGAYNNSTLKVASELGYKTIMWSKDTIDWRDKDSNLIYNRATNNLKGGDLVLMHPTECTLQALPDILKYISNNNLIATTVTNTIN
jgi:peptidoglycan/xylan/chitin deacetylase (PgdA/CDA1 family)